MDIVTKRRAVYTVLSHVLDGDELWDAMWRWESGYSQKSQYELNSFFGDCSDLKAIASQRSRLYRELIGLLIKRSTELKPDPFSEMEAYRKRNGMPAEPVVQTTWEWMGCFNIVVRELIADVSADQAQQIRVQVEKQAQQKGIASELIYAFSILLLGKKHKDLLVVDFDEIKTLLNLAYVALCEQQGPVATDRQLSIGVERAQQEIEGVDARLLLQHDKV